MWSILCEGQGASGNAHCKLRMQSSESPVLEPFWFPILHTKLLPISGTAPTKTISPDFFLTPRCGNSTRPVNAKIYFTYILVANSLKIRGKIYKKKLYEFTENIKNNIKSQRTPPDFQHQTFPCWAIEERSFIKNQLILHRAMEINTKWCDVTLLQMPALLLLIPYVQISKTIYKCFSSLPTNPSLFPTIILHIIWEINYSILFS